VVQIDPQIHENGLQNVIEEIWRHSHAASLEGVRARCPRGLLPPGRALSWPLRVFVRLASGRPRNAVPDELGAASSATTRGHVVPAQHCQSINTCHGGGLVGGAEQATRKVNIIFTPRKEMICRAGFTPTKQCRNHLPCRNHAADPILSYDAMARVARP
jgi:hypothetical protein